MSDGHRHQSSIVPPVAPPVEQSIGPVTNPETPATLVSIRPWIDPVVDDSGFVRDRATSKSSGLASSARQTSHLRIRPEGAQDVRENYARVQHPSRPQTIDRQSRGESKENRGSERQPRRRRRHRGGGDRESSNGMAPRFDLVNHVVILACSLSSLLRPTVGVPASSTATPARHRPAMPAISAPEVHSCQTTHPLAPRPLPGSRSR